jgi:hypothetical protein
MGVRHRTTDIRRVTAGRLITGRIRVVISDMKHPPLSAPVVLLRTWMDRSYVSWLAEYSPPEQEREYNPRHGDKGK